MIQLSLRKLAKNFSNELEYELMIISSVCSFKSTFFFFFFLWFIQEEKTVVDKRTIIEYLVNEGVTSEDISNIMQVRCKQKKRVGETAEKKSSETAKEKKTSGTVDENSNSSIMSIDGKDNSEIIKEEVVVSPKRTAKRAVKEKPIKYGSDEDDDDDQENIDENESDYIGSDSETEKVIKKPKSKPKVQVIQ